MDDGLTIALTKAGECLATALSRELAVRGYPHELHLAVDGKRAVIGSSHKVVRQVELGGVSNAPSALLETGARTVASSVVQTLMRALHEELR